MGAVTGLATDHDARPEQLIRTEQRIRMGVAIGYGKTILGQRSSACV